MVESGAGRRGASAKSVRVSVSFDMDDYAAIKDIAKTNRVSAAWVVRDAVTTYLNARAPLFVNALRGPATDR